MYTAVTRALSPSINDCERSFMPKVPIDVALAQEQHQQYEAALREIGCVVVSLPALPDLPDSTFVEDAAIVLDELAIITRPGVESRRPETSAIAPLLGEFRRLVFISPPGTLEGGDVLRSGKSIFVGKSVRSNKFGIDQLRSFVGPFGYTVTPVDMHDCLHLKSAVTLVSPRTLLLNPQWVDRTPFEDMTCIEVDPSEPFAANALMAGTHVLYPNSFPLTRRRLAEHHISVRALNMSELQKAEGAVTCCSLVFEHPVPRR
jgi:dimethylargininase